MEIEEETLMNNRKGTDLDIQVFATRAQMGEAAGRQVEAVLERLLNQQSEVRMVFAAAPSQLELLNYLREASRIDWRRITAFHMDEYIGLPINSPQSFGHFLRTHLFDSVPFKEVQFMNSVGSRGDLALEIKRYGALLESHPIDIVCLGIGENGHIAFNDPPVADFKDPATVKIVNLDQPCRLQQVHDGMFASLDDVPAQAITLTIPTLVAGKYLVCVVPGSAKQQAVYNTLHGPVNESCPATILRRHPNCSFYLDQAAYGLVSNG